MKLEFVARQFAKYLGVTIVSLLFAYIMMPFAAQGAPLPPGEPILIWDWNSEGECELPPKRYQAYDESSPNLIPGYTAYCPQISNVPSGCGNGGVINAYLDSVGHINTPNYFQALCLYNFYESAAGGAYFDPTSTVWRPNDGVNIRVHQRIPVGKATSLTGFSVVILQKQFKGSNINFEKQGIQVTRNGVEIYRDVKPILASNINNDPLCFIFNGPEFSSDASADVDFVITFGLIHQLIGASSLVSLDQYSAVQVGYDDITVYSGNCLDPPVVAQAVPSACAAGGGAQGNGMIKLSGFEASYKYDFTAGASYSGAASFATATIIPVNGIVTNTLVDPPLPAPYTVRIFKTASSFQDVTVELNPAGCPSGCPKPTGGTVAATAATCQVNGPANNDARITTSGVIGATKISLWPSSPYGGVDYLDATPFTGSHTFNGLPNPANNLTYTVRLWSSSSCFEDRKVILPPTVCPCDRLICEIINS
jgi:hypothetical protein